MKYRIIVTAACFAAIAMMVGCSKTEAMTPTEVVKDFFKAVQNCDGAGMAKHLNEKALKETAEGIRNRLKDQPEERKELGLTDDDMKAADSVLVPKAFGVMMTQAKKGMESSGNKFELMLKTEDEKIEADGKKASVKFTNIFGSSTKEGSLVKVGDTWKFDKSPIN